MNYRKKRQEALYVTYSGVNAKWMASALVIVAWEMIHKTQNAFILALLK